MYVYGTCYRSKQRPEEDTGSPGVNLQAIVSCLIWELGTGLKPSLEKAMEEQPWFLTSKPSL